MTHQRNRRIVLASAVGVAQRGAQLLAALVTLPLLIGRLGVDDFGVWGAATSLAWVSWMLDVGIGAALVTLVPRALAAGQDDEARGYVAAALAGSVALSLILLATGWTASSVFRLNAEPAFLIAGIALALNIAPGLAGRIWLGLQKGHVASGWELAQSALTLVLIVAGVWARAGVAELVAAVYGAMMTANVGSLLHLMIAHPELRPRSAPQRPAFAQVIAHGAPMLGISIASTSTFAFDNALTLAWLGPAASAQMTVALRLCTTASGFLSVISQSFWPAFAEAAQVADRGWMARTLWSGSLTVIGLAVVGSALVVALGAPVLTLWLGHQMALSQTVLWTVGAWITFNSFTLVQGSFLLSVSRLKEQFVTLGLAVTAGLVLKYFAAATFGVAGILAVAPTLTLVLVWPAYIWFARSWFATVDRPERNAP